MKKMFKDSKARSIFSGKGFYIALAVSVAMVGAACYFAYTQTSDNLIGQLDSSMSSAENSRSDNQQVWDKHTDIPKITTAQTHTAVVTTTVTDKPDSDTDSQSETVQTAKPKARKLIMPINGDIINEFSNGELVKSATTGAWQTHNGVDIAAALGDIIVAADGGTVSAVEEDPLWGVSIMIDHGNGTVTHYCNLNKGVTVQVGQEVSSGEEIGAIGDTADIESGEDSHLHFEVIKNGSYIDPVKEIKG